MSGAGFEAQDRIQGRLPVGHRLPRRAENQVDVVGAAEAGLSASSTARLTDQGSCWRPSDASTWGTIDWAPNESLVTPLALYAASLAAVTVSGLHSTVTSAPPAIPRCDGAASRMLPSSSAGRSDGVPPPKKTDVAGPRRLPTSQGLSLGPQAATYRSHRCSRSVQVAKAQ